MTGLLQFCGCVRPTSCLQRLDRPRSAGHACLRLTSDVHQITPKSRLARDKQKRRKIRLMGSLSVVKLHLQG
jgi:hypothetical protein